MLTFKLRTQNLIFLYAMALITTAATGYRILIVVLRSHVFESLVERVTLTYDLAIFHMLFFLLVTVSNPGFESYIFYMAAFLPCTCFAGH